MIETMVRVIVALELFNSHHDGILCTCMSLWLPDDDGARVMTLHAILCLLFNGFPLFNLQYIFLLSVLNAMYTVLLCLI